MITFLTTIAAYTLVPVAAHDPILEQADTFTSPAAAAATEGIYCLDLPEGSASHARVCLIAAEWQQLFDRIEASENTLAGDRARAHAQRFVDNRSTPVTP